MPVLFCDVCCPVYCIFQTLIVVAWDTVFPFPKRFWAKRSLVSLLSKHTMYIIALVVSVFVTVGDVIIVFFCVSGTW